MLKLKLSRVIVESRAVAVFSQFSFNVEGPRNEAGFQHHSRQAVRPADLRGLFLCQK